MRSVGLKTLKNKLSEYVRLAAGGETVLVTDRDRVVAQIGPPHPARSSMLPDALLLEAARQGWMTPPSSVGRGTPAGSYFVEDLRRSLANETRSTLFPGDTSQLVGLNKAADFHAIGKRDVKTSITIPPPSRAGNAATGQLIEGERD